MSVKVAINGYGRIGRNVLRAIYESGRAGEFAVVAINDLGDADTNAHLTQYDTAHGKFPGTVAVDGSDMIVNGHRIKVYAVRNPAEMPWKDHDVDVVLECTGLFTSKAKAGAHLAGGAKKVIISAPGDKDIDGTFVYGVNHDQIKASRHRHLQRLLHDQLPGAAGQGAAREDRHRARPDDDHPRLHQRPGSDRRLPLGPAPRPQRDHVADPGQDRRRRRGRPGAAGTQRQARRLRDARADHQRLGGRPVLRRRARDDEGRDRRRAEGSQRRARSRASSATTPRRWCRSTSTTTRAARSTTPP